jgi:hypothetical protein
MKVGSAMPLTKAEREQLQALSDKAKAEEEADKDYELWVEKGDHRVKLTGAKARAFARKMGVDDDEEEAEEEGAENEGDEEKDPEPPKAGYFNRGTRPPKA